MKLSKKENVLCLKPKESHDVKKGPFLIILQWNHEAQQSGFSFVLNIVDVISMINKVIDNEKLWSIW